jgi:thiol-disulfide isomerase/thioredoxin
VGDEAVDAELLDMQGQKHHLFEAFSNDKYVLLDFWGIGCGPCMMSEPEMREVYEKMKDKLEIVAINQNKLSEWQKHEFSKRIVGKNWNNAMKDISSKYCDMGAIPYYVMISPDKRIVWKAVGYQPGYFMGLAEALNGPKQDNSSNLQLAIRKVDVNANSTIISFRYYGHKNYWFRIAKDSYLTANGKKYKLTAADGIKLDEDNYTQVKASESTNEFLGNTYYTDFTLTFEPFDTVPTTFDFIEGDIEGAFAIRNVSVE